MKPVFPLVRKVVYLNDRFIAGGFDGEVMQSPDGEVWSGSFTGKKEWVTDFTFADGKYYAVQQQDLLVSTNLIDWQRFTNKFDSWAKALLHRDGVLLAAGGRIWRSTNGAGSEVLFPSAGVDSLAYNASTYVGVGFRDDRFLNKWNRLAPGLPNGWI